MANVGASSMSEPDVSVVVPGWREFALTRRCLESLAVARQGSTRAVEVIYVDDASGDETPEQVASAFPDVRVERSPSRSGFGEVANLGVERARAQVVVLLNNDVVVDPGFLDPLVEPLACEDVFAVAGDSLVGGDPERHEGFSRGLFEDGQFIAYQPALDGKFPCPSQTVTTLHAGGGFSAFDRAKFRALGGFARVYAPFYWEDVELSWRAWRRGWTVLFQPRSVLHHMGHGTIRRYPDEAVMAIYERNRLVFTWRNLRDPEMFAAHLERFLDGDGSSLTRLEFALHHLPAALRGAGVPGVTRARDDREILACSAGKPWKGAR